MSSVSHVLSQLAGRYTNRLGDLTLLVLVTGLLAVGTHFWIADRQQLLRTFFPLQELLTPVSCSSRTPKWLQQLSKDVPDQMRTLSNQLAWIDPNGQAFHCETGWVGTPLVSSSLSEKTRFRYGSLTKPLVAAALMELDRRGVLSTETPLIQVLFPDSPAPALVDSRVADIRLHHLLEHRAGLVGRRHQIFLREGRPWCPHSLPKLLEASLQFAPGSQIEYENINYCLVGEAIARAEGMPVRAALDDLLSIRKRGMQFVGEANAEDEVLRDYRNNPFYSATFTGNFDYQAVSATAGLSGSALSYGRLMRELISRNYPGFLQSPAAEAECDSTHLRSCFGPAFFSFVAKNGMNLSVKDGYLPGSSALVVVTPSRGVFVWLGNADIPGVVEGLPLYWLLNYIADHAV